MIVQKTMPVVRAKIMGKIALPAVSQNNKQDNLAARLDFIRRYEYAVVLDFFWKNGKNFKLICFNCDTSTHEAKEEIEKLGLEIADVFHLREFRAKYPEECYENPVIALQAGCLFYGDSPRLYWYNPHEYDHFTPYSFHGINWNSEARFLAVESV